MLLNTSSHSQRREEEEEPLWLHVTDHPPWDRELLNAQKAALSKWINSWTNSGKLQAALSFFIHLKTLKGHSRLMKSLSGVWCRHAPARTNTHRYLHMVGSCECKMVALLGKTDNLRTKRKNFCTCDLLFGFEALLITTMPSIWTRAKRENKSNSVISVYIQLFMARSSFLKSSKESVVFKLTGSPDLHYPDWRWFDSFLTCIISNIKWNNTKSPSDLEFQRVTKPGIRYKVIVNRHAE